MNRSLLLVVCWVAFSLVGCGTLAATPAPTPTGGVGKSAGPLSSRLSRLAGDLASLPAEEQAAALSLPASGPGSLVREGETVLVTVRLANWDDATRTSVTALSPHQLFASPEEQTITLFVPTTRLNTLAGLPGVLSIREELAPR